MIKATTAFEVFIEKEMKANNGTIPPSPEPDPDPTQEPKPSESSYLVYKHAFIAALLLLLF